MRDIVTTRRAVRQDMPTSQENEPMILRHFLAGIALMALAACNTQQVGPVFPTNLSAFNGQPGRTLQGQAGEIYFVDLRAEGGRFSDVPPSVYRISGAWDAAQIHFKTETSDRAAIAEIAEEMCATIGRAPDAIAFTPATGLREARRAEIAQFACV